MMSKMEESWTINEKRGRGSIGIKKVFSLNLIKCNPIIPLLILLCLLNFKNTP